MTATTTTTTATTISEHDTSPSYAQYQQQEEEERAALDAWRATGARLAAAMKVVGTAQQTLDTAREEELRLDQPNKHKAYLAIKDARRQALRARRESFKTRVRAAGLQTKFISLSDKDMDVLEQMEDQAEDQMAAQSTSPRYAPPSSP